MRKIIWLTLIVTLLLSSCSLLKDDETNAEATQTSPASTPIPPPTPLATPQFNEPDSTELTVLNVWVVAETSPLADVPGGPLLAEQLTTFQTNRPDLEINVEVKAPSGQGGALSYLRSGRSIAPSILPDLIVLSADQLEPAAAESLIFPVTELIVPSAFADLYPSAFTLSQVGDEAYGFPFALSNLNHMAYSTAVFTDTIPVSWDEFLADEEARFSFPGAGQPGAELAIQLYLASGGKLANESGQPLLEVEPLANALSYLSTGREEGLIPIQAANMSAFDESWQAFNNGSANSVQTVADRYVDDRDSGLESGYAGVPGPDVPLASIIKAWSWAISTPDPTRQTLVADLLNWLIAGPNMGDWSLAAETLPSRRTAFERWPENDDYIHFIQEELELADPYPYVVSGPALDAVSVAVFEVLSLDRTPQQAAEEAAASINP